MWKQVWMLTKLQICNTGGWNQARYSKDKKQRGRYISLMGVYIFLGLMLAFYSGAIAFGAAFFGLSDLIPPYMLTVVSLVILFFTIFKAGSVLFNMTTYERMISLPVSPAAIVISRFFSMFLQNMVLGMVVLFPAAAVMAVTESVGAGFYIMIFLGALLLPLIPMTIATGLGALISAVSSRMKHKSLVSVVLTLLFVAGCMVLPPVIGQSSMVKEGSLEFTEGSLEFTEGNWESNIQGEWLGEIGEIAKKQLYSLYPPSRLFSAGIGEGDAWSFFLFGALSIGLFVLLIALVQWKFFAICSALNAQSAKKTYQMEKLSSVSPLQALYKRELKRYFSSSIYVLNTAMGHFLNILFAGAIVFLGVEEMEAALQMEGMVSKALPLLLALMCCMAPTTVCSISMEGKQWWIARSLPVSTRQILNSKLLVNLTVALPCYLVTEALLLFLPASLSERVWLFVIPLVYILFSSVMGLLVNCKMPMLVWESETVAVKQGGAILVNMMIGFAAVLVPSILLFLLPVSLSPMVMAGSMVIVGGLTVWFYYKSIEIDLRTIG